MIHLPSMRIASSGLFCAASLQAAIPAMPRLNGGLQSYGAPTSGLSSLVDGKYKTGSWPISAGSWAAWKLPKATGKVVVAWNNPSYAWSDWVTNASKCVQGAALSFPSDYEILTSANSTNGIDGVWTSRLKVTGNKVSSRLHTVQTGVDVWVKLSIQAGNGSLDEVAIHDASASTDDTWAFIGTSISSGAFKGDAPAVNDFQSLVVSGAKGGNSPIVAKAGIPCIGSTDVSNNLGRYLALLGEAKNWAIEMGTNDAWGGGTGNVASFKSALQTVIDSAKGRGIRVLLARPPATDAAKASWQMNQAFLAATDDLVRANNLVAGPDLYDWFSKNPGELSSDGVHPNATGYASIQRLWAQAMLKSVYGDASSVDNSRRLPGPILEADAEGTNIRLPGSRGPLWIVSPDGERRRIGIDGQGRFPRACRGRGVHFLVTPDQAFPIVLYR